MDRTERVTLMNMCMIYDGNRMLMQDKVGRKYNGITFPGGHVEPGEAFTDSVIREVYEETGLTIFTPQLCGVKDWVDTDGTRYMVLLYKTDKFSGKLQSSDEGDVFWVDIKHLKDMNLAEDMKSTLKVFFDDDISELYFYKENSEWIDILK